MISRSDLKTMPKIAVGNTIWKLRNSDLGECLVLEIEGPFKNGMFEFMIPHTRKHYRDDGDRWADTEDWEDIAIQVVYRITDLYTKTMSDFKTLFTIMRENHEALGISDADLDRIADKQVVLMYELPKEIRKGYDKVLSKLQDIGYNVTRTEDSREGDHYIFTINGETVRVRARDDLLTEVRWSRNTQMRDYPYYSIYDVLNRVDCELERRKRMQTRRRRVIVKKQEVEPEIIPE